MTGRDRNEIPDDSGSEGTNINGGKRGFLVSLDPKDLRGALTISEVSVAIT
jgi:hypothetical protein